MPWKAVALGLLLFMAGCSTPSDSNHAGGHLAINVLSLADRGCSPDVFTRADPGVRIFVNGHKVVDVLADQLGHAEIDGLFPVDITGEALVTVSMYESEPGTEIACDVNPGSGMESELHWSGEYQDVTLTGNDKGSSTVHFLLGAAPDPVSNLKASVRGDSADLSWDLPAEPLTGVHVSTGYAPALQQLGGDATTTTIQAGCDGASYVFHVIAMYRAWAIPADVSFETANRAPAAPRILQADKSGSSVAMKWEEPTAHDVVRYDIYRGGPGFQASGQNLIATQKPFADWRNQDGVIFLKGSGDYLRIVATDKGGLSATSPAFEIDGAKVTGTLEFDDGCPRSQT